MQRSLSVISAWPGILATQNLVSGNNTQWITPGWWKRESLVWQDRTCFALNSQCWNNDGISQGNTRGSKGFLWLWKRIAAQGAITSFLFRDELLCLLFIWYLVFMILLLLISFCSHLQLAADLCRLMSPKQAEAAWYWVYLTPWIVISYVHLPCAMRKRLRCWPQCLVTVPRCGTGGLGLLLCWLSSSWVLPLMSEVGESIICAEKTQEWREHLTTRKWNRYRGDRNGSKDLDLEEQ